MADPQHPAVPFEQAVDLLTGEPRPLRPQHPDIAALETAKAICAEHCAFMGEPPCWQVVPDEWPNPNCDEPGCVALADAALRTLTRPVEDEEAQEIAAWLDGSIRKERSTGHRGAAEMLEKIDRYLARLAREKASAEQEISRLRAELEKVVEIANREPSYQEALGRLGDAGRVAERALAAAAGPPAEFKIDMNAPVEPDLHGWMHETNQWADFLAWARRKEAAAGAEEPKPKLIYTDPRDGIEYDEGVE